MPKLLVINPRGVQEVLSIHESGGYFDEKAVLWDERKDGPIPAVVEANLGGIVRDGHGLSVDAAKKAKHDADRAAEAKAKQDKADLKRDARARLESIDWGKQNTVAELKAIVIDLVETLIK